MAGKRLTFLERGEKVVGEADLEDGSKVIVTDQGRKVRIDTEGTPTRMMGPLFSWEQPEAEDIEPEGLEEPDEPEVDGEASEEAAES